MERGERVHESDEKAENSTVRCSSVAVGAGGGNKDGDNGSDRGAGLKGEEIAGV